MKKLCCLNSLISSTVKTFVGFGFLALVGLSANAIAATYYVNGSSPTANDANPGTSAQPWRTIGKAASAMVAGDTTLVAAGTYSGGIASTRAGSSGARIVFQASGVVNTGDWTIAHDYVTVSGFTLNGSDIVIKNANQCEVLNNKINRGAIAWSTLAASNGCLVKGNHLYGALSPGGDWPQINIFGNGHVIEGNEIGPSSDIDAFRIFGTNHIVRGNYVHDLTYSPGSAAHMDIFQTFGDNGWISNNIVIENNRFINSQGQLFNTSQDNVSGINNYVVRNNVFANISQNANVGLPNFYFYNNTLYNTGIIYQVTGGPGKPFNGSNLVVKNNIFVGVAGCGNRDFDNVYNNPSRLSTSRSNNYYANCAGQAMTNFVSEPGGINGGAVNFTNPSALDFSINSPSVAIGAGVALLGFNNDILGVARSAGGAWDIGAFQFGGMSAGLQPPSNLLVR